jgi:ubiquinone biosynthesis UbiH/UbiF/VisC/COQ6 family hydroxylase
MQADLIIQGAGIVGLSLALRCAQEGYDVVLMGTKPVQTFAQACSDHRYTTINRRSQKLFESLGVWDAMHAAASPYTRMVVWDALGFGPLTFDAHAIHQPDLGHVLANAWMLQVLWQALEKNLNIHCCASKAVALHCDAQMASLTLADGGLMKAPLVIAADGAGSWLREAAGIGLHAVQDEGQSTLLSTVTTAMTHAQTAWQRFIPEGPLAFLPLADPYQSVVFWTAKTASIQGFLAQEEASFAKALSQALDHQLGAVLSVQRHQSFVLRGQLAKSATAERVALVGDAMHVIHPLAGQGLNLGLQDVEPLVQALQQARARGIDLGHPLVLRRYARARRAAVQTMSYSTKVLNTLFCSANPAVIGIRTLGLEAVQAMPWFKKQLAFQAMGI